MIFTLLFLFSCTKDSTPTSDGDLQGSLSFDYLNDGDKEDRTNQMTDYLKSSLEIDYKKDFLIANVPDAILAANPSDLEVRLLRIGGNSDRAEMHAQYPMVKEQLQKWLSENSDHQYTSTIQDVSLRYLRLLFLTENTTESNQEVEFLLAVLVDLKAEDLDVLADAYHQIKANLNDSKRIRYYDYLKTVYQKNLTLIRDKAPEYKAAYEKASDHPADRLKYLMYGKDLERRSKSCFHANDLLQFDAQH